MCFDIANRQAEDGRRSKFLFHALNANLAAARRAQVDGRSSASSGAFDVARGASRHTPGARACACRLRRASSLPIIFFLGCPLPDAENPPLLSRASTTRARVRLRDRSRSGAARGCARAVSLGVVDETRLSSLSLSASFVFIRQNQLPTPIPQPHTHRRSKFKRGRAVMLVRPSGRSADVGVLQVATSPKARVRTRLCSRTASSILVLSA